MTDTDVPGDEQLNDRPRSYYEILADSGAFSGFFWMTVALVSGFFSLITLSFIIHLHVVEVGHVAAAEQQTGNLVSDMPAFGLYGSTVLYLGCFVSGLLGLSKEVGVRA